MLIPLGAQCTYEQSRTLGELIARFIGEVAARHRDDRAQRRRDRGGKVYLDYLQNASRPAARRAVQRAAAAAARRCRCRSSGKT